MTKSSPLSLVKSGREFLVSALTSSTTGVTGVSVTMLFAIGVTLFTRLARTGELFLTMTVDSLITGADLAVLVADERLRVAIEGVNVITL